MTAPSSSVARPASTTVSIRLLTADDHAAFHTLRRSGLLESPQAFGASPEDEDCLTEDQIRQRLVSGPGRGVFGAWHGTELVGIVALQPEGLAKLSHKAMIFGMYVAPDHRGQGLGRVLLSAALGLVRHAPAIRQVGLYVNLGQQAAVKLYLSLGFVPFGHERDAICVDGRYYDEWLMVWRKPESADQAETAPTTPIDKPDPVDISTDPSWLDTPLIHRFLSEHSNWARDIPPAVVERAIQNSLCFGVYLKQADGDGGTTSLSPQRSGKPQQIGFARIVTDRATFAYLADVFVLPAYRGRGYSLALMHAIDQHPDLQGLRRFVLATSDAHGLYARFGFTAPTRPQTLMERYRPQVYESAAKKAVASQKT